MLASQSRLLLQLNQFYNERVIARNVAVAKSIRDVCKIVQEVLHEVETQEPRFVSSLTDAGAGQYDGLRVLSPNEFEVVLYLNQMGIFNFVDDGTLPGCAVLKLSDGRKRSMSLWVEFITASGYLSARKIRSRFQTLVAAAVEKCGGGAVKMVPDTTEVRLRVRDRYVVEITPAFRCAGLWPRSAAHWPLPAPPPPSLVSSSQLPSPPSWPTAALIADVKNEGFELLSKESPYAVATGQRDRQTSADGDSWTISFHQAESLLLSGGCRRRCVSVLKTLRDRHLDLPGRPVDNYHIRTLVLYECEKHPADADWDDSCLGDRVNGVLLQLISCLQNRRCPHYFVPALDLFRARPASALDVAARQAWRILRELLTNARSLEKL